MSVRNYINWAIEFWARIFLRLYQQPAGLSPPPEQEDFKVSETPSNSRDSWLLSSQEVTNIYVLDKIKHRKVITSVVVTWHGPLHPLCQQVRAEVCGLTGDVAVAGHVAVTWTSNIQHLVLLLLSSPLYLMLLLIIWSSGRNVEMFGSGSLSITRIFIIKHSGFVYFKSSFIFL